jgi:cytochrome c peroxidase
VAFFLPNIGLLHKEVKMKHRKKLLMFFHSYNRHKLARCACLGFVFGLAFVIALSSLRAQKTPGVAFQDREPDAGRGEDGADRDAKKIKRGLDDDAISQNAQQMLAEGKQTFRFDTFGDEAFWGGQLRLQETLATLSPSNALALGLKVDVAALPPRLVQQIRHGKLDVTDPKNTAALLQANAVVGVKGFFTNGTLSSVGISCALCHSTVDNSLAPGIGQRLDGWPNRDLNVGAIIASAPTVAPFADLLQVDEATVRTVLLAWGPGKFDAELSLDGKGFRPGGKSAATLIPPAFGLAGVNLHTWTGWGSVTHWNAFVANIEMHGQGNFFDQRLDNAEQFPVAARARLGHITNEVDLISSKLPALHFYQLGIPAPKSPPDTFNAEAATRGRNIFNTKGNCASCHVPPLFTEPGWNLHTPAEIGIDDFQANRAPDRRYRTSPLKGLFTHTKGGFFHDGRFETLLDVINHYDATFTLGLSDAEKQDLVEYLKSI